MGPTFLKENKAAMYTTFMGFFLNHYNFFYSNQMKKTDETKRFTKDTEQVPQPFSCSTRGQKNIALVLLRDSQAVLLRLTLSHMKIID